MHDDRDVQGRPVWTVREVESRMLAAAAVAT